MKKSKYTDTQIVSILKEAEAGQPVKEICPASSRTESGNDCLIQAKNPPEISGDSSGDSYSGCLKVNLH